MQADSVCGVFKALGDGSDPHVLHRQYRQYGVTRFIGRTDDGLYLSLGIYYDLLKNCVKFKFFKRPGIHGPQIENLLHTISQQSICLSVCLSIYLPTYLPTSLSLFFHLSIYLSVCLSTYLPTSMCLSVYLPLYLAVCLCIYLPTYVPTFLSVSIHYLPLLMSIYRSMHPSTYISIYPSTYLPTYVRRLFLRWRWRYKDLTKRRALFTSRHSLNPRRLTANLSSHNLKI